MVKCIREASPQLRTRRADAPVRPEVRSTATPRRSLDDELVSVVREDQNFDDTVEQSPTLLAAQRRKNTAHGVSRG